MGIASSFGTRSRRLAFTLLLFFGAIVVLLGIAVLSLGLAVTHNDTFHDTTGLKEQVETTVDYVQYWIGIPYIFTGLSVACSAVNLRRVSLTVCTVLLSLICVVLSLAGLLVDGPDFVLWKNYRALQQYWENQDDYACSSVGDACVCTNGTSPTSITSFTDCETLMKLASIYGVLIGCFVFAFALLLASVFIIVYIVTTKREKAKRQGKPYQSTKVVEVKRSVHPEPMFENTVRDETNRGYEYADRLEEQEKPVPVQNRKYKHQASDKIPDSTSQQNVDASSMANQAGVVMMDPGRFRLGDDDIY